ncbi:hypothetical protein B0A55_10855 [Friedmanniomyces simplex]|uniref:Uncharacterized protein n=1 Tax=Friedmanniomyces simplex TaxID=329884 RepID=A0A4V6WL04_9PEZI|nr:hypothetical protein B0A55_10855 [Friedmanniomyces simplex]
MDKSSATSPLHPAAAKVSLPRTPTRKPVVLQEQHISRQSGQPESVLARPRSSATPQPPSLLNDDSPQQCTNSGMLHYISASNLQEKRITSQQLQQAQYGPVAGRSDTQREPPKVSRSQDSRDVYQKALWRFAPPVNGMDSLGQRAAAISSNGARRWSFLESARNDVYTTPSQQQIWQISSHPQQSPPRDRRVTVLNSIVLPALKTALDRRSYQLNLIQQQHAASHTSQAFNVSGLASGVVQHSTISEDILLMRQTHDQIREHMGKIVRLFEEMDYWDGVAPVLRGDGVEGLLEGFLQEVFCLVDVGDV